MIVCINEMLELCAGGVTERLIVGADYMTPGETHLIESEIVTIS